MYRFLYITKLDLHVLRWFRSFHYPQTKDLKQYLKKNDLKAVPFDKGAGYCLMTSDEYESRLNCILSGRQFDMLAPEKRPMVIRVEEEFNRELRSLLAAKKITTGFFEEVKSTGATPARLYGLAKVHKKDTPLRPVLSLPGSCYDKLNKTLAKFFDDIPGSNIETSSSQMKELLTAAVLEDDEVVFSMDVKSLYTNVPVLEAINLAADKVYQREEQPAFDKSTFIQLMRLAVCNVCFLSGGTWYTQNDGVAMGSTLAVILANLWLKEFEGALAGKPLADSTTESTQNNTDSSTCKSCLKRVTFRGFSIRCHWCATWYHRKCANLSLKEIKEFHRAKRPWFCGCSRPSSSARATTPPAKVFGRYMDDIIRTAKREEIRDILAVANSLHPCLEFTIEEETEEKIPFLDMLLERTDNRITTSWYSKPTDTGLMMSFRACAPTRYKKNIIEGTVHRLYNTTSSWTAFHQGLESAKITWEKNQYPPDFYEPIVADTIGKFLTSDTNENNTTVPTTRSNAPRNRTERPLLILQYRGTISDKLLRKVRSSTNGSVVFTTRKLKTCLPSLKSPIPKELRSHVVYQIDCSGCNASYVGQTCRHLTTRLTEHREANARVGSHFRECGLNADDISAKIIDVSPDRSKLLTLEALHIAMKNPALNNREEYRARELTLRL